MTTQPLADLFRGFRMVLSVQCGAGDFLSRLEELGVPSVGIDSDPANVERCLQRKLVVFHTTWQTLRHHRRKFDGIHVPLGGQPDESWQTDLAELLRVCAAAMLPSGLLVLSGRADLAATAANCLPADLEVYTESDRTLLLTRRADTGKRAPSPGVVVGPYADAFVGCKHVLDLGSGHGRFLDALHVRDIGAIGVEHDAELVAACVTRGLKVERGGAELLAEMPSRFDGIHLGNAAEKLSRTELTHLLAYCRHALQPNARLLIRTTRQPHDPKALRSICEAAGFSGCEIGVVPGDPTDYFAFCAHDGKPATELPEGKLPRLEISRDPIEAPLHSLHDLERFERRAFSQGGEDGVIEAIFALIGTTNRYYVEFGCGDGLQCNTANLRRQGWTGLLMDGMAEPKAADAVIHQEWISADNINGLFAKHGVPPEPDLVSIDLDGNDYWVWRSLESKPRLIVAEYNANISPDQSLTIAHDPDHRWNGTDYYGASLLALERLGREKGYRLVHCNQAGVNAFFVRADLCPDLPELDLETIYRPPNYWYRGYRQLPDLSRSMAEV